MTHNVPSLKVSILAFVAGMFLMPTTGSGQGVLDAGSACGCPELSARDTVWIDDNSGSGVGTMTWTCDHIYVLTEQVFVNAADTLTLEPGTVVLGAPGQGMSVIEVPANNDVGLVRSVSYSSYPGALVVARGGMLMAAGNATCPIQFSFLGDPMDGSVGLDVQGQWGGVVLCGAGALNTFYLEGTESPSQTGGVGTGEDRAEGIVDGSGQDRHVYGGNTDPDGSSGVLRHVSIRHGSTNLGWNQFLNGNETDLLQLAGCGSGTEVEYVELVGSADDGLHILGGTVEVRHVVSAFHAEDAFESDQGWQGAGQFLFGIQDTALAHPTNPPMTSQVWMMQGDDFEEFNMDLYYEPYTSPWMSNLTLLTNGNDVAVRGLSLPGGDWVNSIVHGVSESALSLRYSYYCDGYAAILPANVGGGFSVLRMRNWMVSGTDEAVDDLTFGTVYGTFYQSPITTLLNPYLVDSGFTFQSLLTDGSFALESGLLTEGLDPRPLQGETVSAFYQYLDPRLESVSYHGAFHPTEDPWFLGWSMLSAKGLYGVVQSVPGCTYAFACNYNAEATEDDGSCEVESCAGCTYTLAPNYDDSAVYDDGSCTFEFLSNCPGDLNGDGVVSSIDLLEFLSLYGEGC
ncbi:MAG: hypothetical protein VXY03_02945 [Bacteroidota bacterium]|nr:hypothetical protein [Bacteroidota bacterium]